MAAQCRGVPVACRSRDASSRTEGRRVASRPAVRALLQVTDPSAWPARPASRLYTERPSLLRSPREKIDSSKWSLPSPPLGAPRPACVVFSRRASYPRDAASAGPERDKLRCAAARTPASPRRLPPRRVSRFFERLPRLPSWPDPPPSGLAPQCLDPPPTPRVRPHGHPRCRHYSIAADSLFPRGKLGASERFISRYGPGHGRAPRPRGGRRGEGNGCALRCAGALGRPVAGPGLAHRDCRIGRDGTGVRSACPCGNANPTENPLPKI